VKRGGFQVDPSGVPFASASVRSAMTTSMRPVGTTGDATVLASRSECGEIGAARRAR